MPKPRPEDRCLCPICKGKPFDSYRKFSAHWQMKHPHLVKPEKETILEMTRNGDTTFSPELLHQDTPAVPDSSVNPQFVPTIQTTPPMETGAPPPASAPPPAGVQQPQYEHPGPLNIPRIDKDQYEEDPLYRLAFILDVHGTPQQARDSVLKIVQLHPLHLQNPMNLHSLLANTLPKQMQPRIQLMISEFTTPYPEEAPQDPFAPLQAGMMGGAPGMSQAYPPYQGYGGYGGGGGRQIYNVPNTLMPHVQPQGDSTEKVMAMTVSMMKMFTEMTGGNKAGAGDPELKEMLKEMKANTDRIIEQSRQDSEQMRDKYDEQIKEIQTSSREQVDELKESLHNTQLGYMQQQVQALQSAKVEEMSEGIGSLARDVGEGVGAEMASLRESLGDGVNKVIDIIGKATPGGGTRQQTPAGNTNTGDQPARQISVADASQLLDVESDILQLSQDLQLEAIQQQAQDLSLETEGAGRS